MRNILGRIILFIVVCLFQVSLVKAATVYVKIGSTGSGTAWADAYGSLHDALAVANPGDQIWMAQGVYTPTADDDRHVRFVIKPGIKIYGGFNGTETLLNQRDSSLLSRKTIISGEIQDDGDNSNNAVNLFYIDNLSSPVYINSLIFEDGNSSYTLTDELVNYNGIIHVQKSDVYFDNIKVSDNAGYGIYIHEANVKINKATITNNIGGGLGGGISVNSNLGTRPPMYISITNSSIIQNEAAMGAAIFAGFKDGDTLLVENCKLNNNVTGDMGGGAVYAEYGHTIMNKVEIKNNEVTGMWNGGGGIFMTLGSIAVHDMLLADNQIAGEEGGGIMLWSMTQGTFVNCTFAGNKAGNFNGNQMYLVTCTNLDFQNCLFDSVGHLGLADFAPWWGWEYSPNTTFTNCLFEGAFPSFWIDGGGNVTHTNPAFAGTGDYSLSDSSLAIDAGDNSFRTVSYLDDLSGNIRISNTTVDIGCYEFIQKNSNPNGVENVALHSRLKIYPNPVKDDLIVEGAAIGSEVVLFDILGTRILSRTILSPMQTIDISELSSGIYFLSSPANGKGSFKLLKQ